VRGSFRDPSGFVFFRDGVLYRQVNQRYRRHYDHLMTSGLYGHLVDAGLLVPHERADDSRVQTAEAYRVLKPLIVPFISYPYEWSFSQYRDAALATLAAQQAALRHGMCLKDASAYNVQFLDGRPVLIDTLSFETYREGEPWVAYGQFCRHFLAPLALMAHVDLRLGQLARVHIDGIPLDMASSMLPLKTRLRFSLLAHVHAHARSQRRYADRGTRTAKGRMSLRAMEGLADSLVSAVSRLAPRGGRTVWSEYYDQASYSQAAMTHKTEIVTEYLSRLKPAVVWDLGANTGRFSRLAAQGGSLTVSFDSDPLAVELNYRRCRQDNETRILPLVVDLFNPSPAIGWENSERMSLAERGSADAVMALALVHHLAIANNVPLERLAVFFAGLADTLMIEFVPKTDSQVQRLLASREDVFDRYDRTNFEQAFGRRFEFVDVREIRDSERTMYLMRRRSAR